MNHIRHILVVGIGMNGGHNPLLNAKRIIEGLAQRCKAVSSTTCVRYTLNVTGKLIIVNAQDDSRVDIILCRHGQHNLACTCLDVVAVAALGRFF